MNKVLHLARKDLVLVCRDRIGLFFIAVFPVAMGLLFGMIGASMGSSDSSTIDIAVVDQDDSEMSQLFVEALSENPNLKVYPSELSQATDQVRKGKRVGMVVLPAGFGENAGLIWQGSATIQLGMDPSRKAESGMLHGYIMQAMSRLMMARFQDPGSYEATIDQAKQQVNQQSEMPMAQRLILNQMFDSMSQFLDKLGEVQQMESEQAGDQQPNMQLAEIEMLDVTRQEAPDSARSLVKKIRSRWDISFPSAILWGVLGCTAGFAISMVRERARGTYLRLQVAPLHRSQILAGKATACYVTVMIVTWAMIALGCILGMKPRNPALLVMATFCIAFCFMGVMMLMSVIGKTEEAVSGAGWGANILMAMFGGGMFPLAFMPDFFKTLSHFSPVKWGILSLEGAIWRSFDLLEMLTPCGVLIGIGLTCLTIGIFILTHTDQN